MNAKKLERLMSKKTIKYKLIIFILIITYLIFILINEFSQLTYYDIGSFENTNFERKDPTRVGMENITAKRIPVLTYHMIVYDWEKKRAKNRGNSIVLSLSSFKKQMKWLKKRKYFTLNCKEFYLWHQGKIKLPKKSVLITFDGGSIGQAKFAMPILKKYNMKGTTFIIGKLTYNNKKGIINYNQINEIRKYYPNFEFQSHTFDLHIRFTENVYDKTLKDALLQKKYYNFQYIAYPYGDYSSEMIKAYNDSGIKMAFTYGKNGYATREQDIFKIRRIKVYSKESFSKFTRWFLD